MSKINNNRLIDILPPNMTDDTIKALSFAIDKQHLKLANTVKKAIVLGDISKVDARTLDAISLDMGVDEYDVALPYQTKLELFKENVYRNKFTKGTAKTVARAVDILYGGAEVLEWYDTDLDPYEFKVKVKAQPDTQNMEQLLNKITTVVNKAKNVRSHLAGITLYIPTTAPIYTAMHHTVATRISIAPYLPHDLVTPPSAVSTGAFVKTGMRITIEPKLKPI